MLESESVVNANSAERSGSSPTEGGTRPGRELAFGARKAAVLVLALEESVASELMQTLTDSELQKLTTEIARLGVVDQSTLSAVLHEFHDLGRVHGILREGGLDQAIRLLERSFSPERSRHLVRLLEAQRPQLPFAFLSGAEVDALRVLLEGEHPQTVAVVLAHMAPTKAAELLESMDEVRRRDLIRRVATLAGTHEEILDRLESTLRDSLDLEPPAASQKRPSGVEAAAGILRMSGRDGRRLLGDLREESPDLVEDIYRRMYTFDDIARLDDRSVQTILKEVDRRQLTLALKTASSTLREKVFRNLSRRAEEMVKEEMELLGPVRVSDVEAARQSIVESVLELEEVGAIYVEGRGSREDRLVY